MRRNYIEQYYYDKYKTDHKDEIDKYRTAVKYLKINKINFADKPEDYEAKLNLLQNKFGEYGADYLDKSSEEFKALLKIRDHVNKVFDDMYIKRSDDSIDNNDNNTVQKESLIKKIEEKKRIVEEQKKQRTDIFPAKTKHMEKE